MTISSLLYPEIESSAPYVSHAKGIYIYDDGGNEYIDGCSGAMTVNIGHCVDDVTNAAIDQMKEITFAYRSQWRNRSSEQLAERIVELSSDKAAVFFLNSGSEANEAAYRLCLQYFKVKGLHKKRHVISRKPSNHGNTIASLSIGEDVRRPDLGSLILDTTKTKLGVEFEKKADPYEGKVHEQLAEIEEKRGCPR